MIELCYSLAKIEASTAGSSYAGGLVGTTSNETTVKTSFSDTSKVQAVYVGGLVSDNSGLISECYSKGEYTGYDVGGLAYKNKNEIINCYTVASVVGIGNKKNVVAGIVAYLPEGGNVKYCFSSASISGTDDCLKFAETSARIRYTDFVNWFDVKLGAYEPGTLTNCIVINYGEAVVQSNFLFFGKNDFVEYSEDDILGMGQNKPFEDAGFTTQSGDVWEYPDITLPEPRTNPELKNCVKPI